MALLLLVVFTALVFEFINGFHDTANAIATSVATKVLTPRQAIFLASITNLLGALWGTAVAKTIASGLVDTSVVNSEVIFCALLGGIVWNLITWWFGIPSSSSHALIGGLCGAALAAAHNDLSVIIWSHPSEMHWYEGKGVLWKVIVPMIFSPMLGFTIAIALMALLYFSLRYRTPRAINAVFGKLQIFSAAGMGFMHGTNDAQKTMGIIALALLAATKSGVFADLPSWLLFLRVDEPAAGKTVEIATWIKVMCALTMAAGTAMGGWKIIKTLGHRMAKLQPIHGFAAETSSSLVLFTASHFGIPVSTTHNISASVMGVGAAKRFSAVRWTLVERMMWAWILTLPCSGIVAYLSLELINMF
ncbi:MAG: inorganic phosphate transporter [Oligoflexia bacterium]|nr:inorganic phosphate transporter [Oligoflexia bacterium]